MSSTLTIFFENPFWVAVLEQTTDDQLQVARYVFGAEPSDAEVYAFIQAEYTDLIAHLSEPIEVGKSPSKPMNPKRQQRLVRKQMAETKLSTRSQDALRLQRESQKKEKVIRKRLDKQAEKDFKREQKIRKRKDKHRGH